MNFGEKLFQLRKERGFTQEALAEQIGTTRQAVSKWENNQGFPETEKLLQLSNIFEVSIDFLLKEERDDKKAGGQGYYVSEEKAKGFLANQKKLCCYIGIGFMALVTSGVPYTIFQSNIVWRYFGMAVCVVIGVFCIVLGIFSEQQEYNILKKEPLLFDFEYLKELKSEYYSKKKKYILIAIPCTVLFVVGLITLILTGKGYLLWSEYHSFVFLGFSVSIFGFVYSFGLMEAYELLVENERLSKSLFFRLKKRLREKIDKALG